MLLYFELKRYFQDIEIEHRVLERLRYKVIFSYSHFFIVC